MELDLLLWTCSTGTALKAWGGKEEHVSVAQDAFYKRAKLNSLATKGEYSSEME